MRLGLTEAIRLNLPRAFGLGVLLAVLANSGGAVNAQTAAEPWIDQAAYVKKLVGHSRAGLVRLRSDFKTALAAMPLSANQREVASHLDDIDIVITDNDLSITGVASEIENGRRRVVVSAGFLLAMDMVNRAGVEAAIFAVPQEKVQNYLIYAQIQLRQFMFTVPEGNRPKNLQRFCRQAELGCDRFDKSPLAPFYASTLEAANLAGLAFVLGHELAHHILGHLNCATQLQFKEESAADLFGLKLALASKHNPIYPAPGIGSYLVLFTVGRDTSLSPEEDKYPAPICRFSQSLRQAISATDRDAEFQAQLRQLGATAMWQQIRNYMPNFGSYTRSCNFAAHEESLHYQCQSAH